MKTSINLPDFLVSEIQLWNKGHPDKQIGISGTCRKALEEALARAKESDSIPKSPIPPAEAGRVGM